MDAIVSPETVVRFLHYFEAEAMKEDFGLLEAMIDERAIFRFNDGDHVGRKAVQAAFERTWKGNPTVKRARFHLADIVVLTTDGGSATATYTYIWEGSQGGESSRSMGAEPACSCTRLASSGSSTRF